MAANPALFVYDLQLLHLRGFIRWWLEPLVRGLRSVADAASASVFCPKILSLIEGKANVLAVWRK
eukprot:3619133-Amphidinium_carterae.2